MIHRERLDRPEYVYPVDEWRMVETRFYPRFLPATETIFSTANGYLGMRGSFEEGAPVFHGGTFINGFYESWPIIYGEQAYGFARTGQTIVSLPDTKIIRLFVDDEPFYLPTARLLSFERVLDMRAGTLDRAVLWETPAGKRVSITSRRLVSFQHRHLAAISYEVTVLNAEAPVVISSEVRPGPKDAGGDQSGAEDPRRTRQFGGEVLLRKGSNAKDRRIVLRYATCSSGMTLACGIDHGIETDCTQSYETRCSEDSCKVVFSVDARPGVPVRLTKYVAYHTSRSAPPEELGERTERTLNRAVAHGFEELLVGQRHYMDRFWQRSDVEVRGDPFVQQALRFNLFQICQATISGMPRCTCCRS
jgi:alpha,alpha-trehalose phosphorylase